MSNKQIKDLTSIGSNIDAATDMLRIQKADGSTYKVTVDQIVNSSAKVSYGSALGPPQTFTEKITTGATKTISRANLFATNSVGIFTIKSSGTVNWRTSLNTIDLTIVKTAGLNSVTVNGAVLQVGGQITVNIGNYRGKIGAKTFGTLFSKLKISITKDSLIIDPSPAIIPGGSFLADISGQASIAP